MKSQTNPYFRAVTIVTIVHLKLSIVLISAT